MIFVIVPAVGIVPPVTVYVMLVELTILATRQLLGDPPYNVPVPAVAVIASPTFKPAVDVIPVIVAVQGPVPVIVPTVPVALTMPAGV